MSELVKPTKITELLNSILAETDRNKIPQYGKTLSDELGKVYFHPNGDARLDMIIKAKINKVVKDFYSSPNEITTTNLKHQIEELDTTECVQKF